MSRARIALCLWLMGLAGCACRCHYGALQSEIIRQQARADSLRYVLAVERNKP